MLDKTRSLKFERILSHSTTLISQQLSKLRYLYYIQNSQQSLCRFQEKSVGYTLFGIYTLYNRVQKKAENSTNGQNMMLNENKQLSTIIVYQLQFRNTTNSMIFISWSPSSLRSLNYTIDMHTASAYTHAYMVILLMQI